MTITSNKKEYRGDPVEPNRVIVKDANGRSSLTPAKSQGVINHSPDGFNWGYGGSGPAQLALALLIDYFEGDDRKALFYYQDFKWKTVALWDSEKPWAISTDEIKEVIEAIGAARLMPATAGTGVN